MTSGHESLENDRVSIALSKAEKAIKQSERLSLKLPVAAVNQLRYAAKHLAEARRHEKGSDAEHEQLYKAEGHCIRARYDALDSIVYSHLDFIAAFQDWCRTRRNLEKVYPEIRHDYDAIAVIQEKLQLFPRVQDMNEDELADLEHIAHELTAFKRKILRLMPTVQKLEQVAVSKEASSAARQFLLSFTVSVAGTALGLFGAISTVWNAVNAAFGYKVAAVVGTVVLFAIATHWLYGIATRKLLSCGQREALLGVADFSFS